LFLNNHTSNIDMCLTAAHMICHSYNKMETTKRFLL
jgi:hypothetical protein